MNEDMKQALILAVLGFVIMVLASFGVMRITSVEVACTIVIILGALLVVIAIVLVCYPKSMDYFRRPENVYVSEEKTSGEEPKQ